MHSSTVSAARSSLVLAIGVVVSMSAVAASKPPQEAAASNKLEPQSDEATANVKGKPGGHESSEKSPSVNLVIAKHVLMWDENIVTWEQVVAGSQAIRKRHGAPIHPTFHVTKGAIEAGFWDSYQEAARDSGKDLFEPAGTSFRSMSYRASQRFDALRTQGDLASKPENICTGAVLDPAGNHQPGATVVLIPEGSPIPVNLKRDLSLHDPLDEIWTRTDQDGRFRIIAADSTGLLVVLAPSGSALIPIPKYGESVEIRLIPHAEVKVSSAGNSRQELSMQVFCPGFANPKAWFDIVGIPIAEKATLVRLPPGYVVVSREIEMGQGIRNAVSAQVLELESGARRQLTLNAVDADAPSPPFLVRPPANVIPAHFSERALRSLDKPTNVEWRDLPLDDGVSYLSEFHDISIRVDKGALAAAKISLANIPMTLRLEGVSLRSALKVMLEPAGLGFYIDAKGLVVTTKEKAAEQSRSAK